MTLAEFKQTVNQNSPPPDAGPLLRALWLDARGDWNTAHDLAQSVDGADAAWVHAYLHRKEGDESNARYWYARARRPFSELSLEEEWNDIVSMALSAP